MSDLSRCTSRWAAVGRADSLLANLVHSRASTTACNCRLYLAAAPTPIIPSSSGNKEGNKQDCCSYDTRCRKRERPQSLISNCSLVHCNGSRGCKAAILFSLTRSFTDALHCTTNTKHGFSHSSLHDPASRKNQCCPAPTCLVDDTRLMSTSKFSAAVAHTSNALMSCPALFSMHMIGQSFSLDSARLLSMSC